MTGQRVCRRPQPLYGALEFGWERARDMSTDGEAPPDCPSPPLCFAAASSFSLFTGRQNAAKGTGPRCGNSRLGLFDTFNLFQELFCLSYGCRPQRVSISFPQNSSGNFCRYPVSRLLARLLHLFSWEQTVAVCIASVVVFFLSPSFYHL